MILLSLEVEGFRSLAARATIQDVSPGLNILAGPNGSGKSTILAALRHALVDSYNLTGNAARDAMKPWGRELTPRIRVTFQDQDAIWRLEKRFLSGAMSRLERREGGAFIPYAEGKAADQRVREMLTADAPSKGLAAETHLGLLHVLWTPQGAQAAGPLPGPVRGLLEASLGAALRSPAGEAITSEIEARYGEYFTATGRPAKNSPERVLAADLERLRADAAALRTTWEAAAASRANLAAALDRVTAIESEIAAIRPALERWTIATARVREAGMRLEPLEIRLREWRGDQDSATSLAGEIAMLTAQHDAAMARLTAAKQAEAELSEADRDLDRTRGEGEDARGWAELLQWRELSLRRTALLGKRAALAPPPRKDLAAARELDVQVRIQEAAARAAALRVTVSAEAPLTIETAGASASLASGDQHTVEGTADLSLRLPGIASIRVEAAAGEAAKAERERRRLLAELDTLLGGATLEQWSERDSRVAALDNELRTINAQWEPLEARALELRVLAARRPEWEANPPSVEALRLAWKQKQAAIQQARLAAGLAQATGAESELRARLTAAREQSARLAERLAARETGSSLAGLTEEHRAAAAERDAAVDAEVSARAALPAGGSSEALARRAAELETERETARRRADSLRGECGAYAGQSLYTRLGEAESALTGTEVRWQREQRRTAAFARLRDELSAARRAQVEGLPGRLSAEATAIWRQIAGPGAPALLLTADWTLSGFQVPDAEQAAALLSGGESEQAAFAIRLALARHLAGTGRQLAVFDDAFLATDATRARRILDLLAEAARDLQVLIVTCHPERYAGLEAARRFDTATWNATV